ncbi:M24 family metallopeptidase [Streptococcus sp. zg-JUN1979]|uniref:M24 family metallopeptidase n=1 Tax=Streptococcus sp. zg-JUN1979 TaxID=3391450 RepID=UPI0039A71246
MGYQKQRLQACEAVLREIACDALLVTNLTNIYYLSGFHGTEATLFISSKRRVLVTDSRYSLMAKETVHDVDIIESREPFVALSQLIAEDNIATIGFDDEVSYRTYKEIETTFSAYRLLPMSHVIERLRMVKDEDEIAIIKKACQISDQAFHDVLDFIKPNHTTELDVSNFLDFRMRELGATGPSFEFIVASGARSEMPHGVATDKIIRQGEMLTLDFGCYYEHYVSDMTRTIHIGEPSDEERAIYDCVLASNQALIDAVCEGMTYRDYDKIARRVIEEAGYGAYFTHGIGHGIGLDIHEIPYFGKSDDKVVAGMTLTDEPGIYLDGKYGVRIEDDILITKTGCEVLTLAPKELIIL